MKRNDDGSATIELDNDNKTNTEMCAIIFHFHVESVLLL